MAKARRQMSPTVFWVVFAAMTLVCLTLFAMVVAGAESTMDAIGIVATTLIVSGLYGMLAVRIGERARRERQDGPRD